MSELPNVPVCCICKTPDPELIIQDGRYIGKPICKTCNESREKMKTNDVNVPEIQSSFVVAPTETELPT